MRKFIILSSILILCVYFSTAYKSYTEKSTEMEHLTTEENENIPPAHSFTSESDTQVQEKSLDSTLVGHNDIKIDPVDQQAKVPTEDPALVNSNKNISIATICNNEPAKKGSEKELDFYVSANIGMVYHDNSEIFVKGIKAIIKKAIDLIDKRYGEGWVSWIMGETLDIKKLNSKIHVDFQWLSNASLGYHAGRNGKVDFEIMYSKIKIKDENPSKIFDETAGIFAFLLNFYYNPEIQNTKFAPYIGFGIGPTVFRLKRINSPSKDLMPLNVPWFAYQVKFGVEYPIISKVKTFLGYRYFSIPIPVADDISTHNVEIGLLFNF